MTGDENVHVVVPIATTVTFPALNAVTMETKAAAPRVPRSVQLHLARSVTFGVLGDDNNIYPSTKWQTENQGQYTRHKKLRVPEPQSECVLASIDTRKHNPQSRKIFRFKGIGKKPICSVDDLTKAPSPEPLPGKSIYMTTYTERKGEPREIIHRVDADVARLEHCIVPLNDFGNGLRMKPEMMLPVCDPGFMPSAKEPHKYLARKKRIPPPFKNEENRHVYGCGVVYPNLEHPRMTSYTPGLPRDGADLPFDNEDLSRIPDSTERVSVTSLMGLPFTRRKFLAQKGHGVIPGTGTTVSNQEDNSLLPYMKAKLII